jgi:hypothetical protein
MRVFLVSVFTATVIAAGAMLLLDQSVRQAEQAFTSPTSVRNPSHGSGRDCAYCH